MLLKKSCLFYGLLRQLDSFACDSVNRLYLSIYTSRSASLFNVCTFIIAVIASIVNRMKIQMYENSKKDDLQVVHRPGPQHRSVKR